MNDELISLDRSDNILTITLNRPNKANALNQIMLQNLADAFAEVKKDKELRAVLISGTGDREFCAGADLVFTAGAVTVFQHWIQGCRKTGAPKR